MSTENEIPEGFEPVYAPDGAHHFARALQCIDCEAVLTGESNSPEDAMTEAIELALAHTCE